MRVLGPGSLSPMNSHRTWILGVALSLAFSPLASAWDYNGHRLVNQVALSSLPKDYPAFVHAPEAEERVAFLSLEPDRWRNTDESFLQQANGLDHYINFELLELAHVDLDTLSDYRLTFARQFAEGRREHLASFPRVDPSMDKDHLTEWPGFLPWAIAENYAKLRSEFSYYKEYLAYGTPEEVANARADILYTMGVLGHYVGDAAQPLHSTIHHHGWVGPNPKGYTTKPSIHAWIDGGYIAKVGVTIAELRARAKPARALSTAARADGRDPVFVQVVSYVHEQLPLVEPLYALEKEGKLSGVDASPDAEGRVFIDRQLVKAGEMLASLWETAWLNAGPDIYLRSSLVQRKAREHP